MAINVSILSTIKKGNYYSGYKLQFRGGGGGRDTNVNLGWEQILRVQASLQMGREDININLGWEQLLRVQASVERGRRKGGGGKEIN